MSNTPSNVRVGIEAAPRKVFASALDWPGWSRSGKTRAAALEALAAARGRYARVAEQAGAEPPPDGPYVIIEELPGDASTAFGVPAVVFDADRAPVDGAEAERLAAIVAAAFAVFDQVVAAAPAELRKGPRGGGRDRDKVVDHVHAAHEAYTRPVGARVERGAADPARRAAMLDVLRHPSDGAPPLPARWPQRYAARRVAWHTLDHAWEIEDRSPS